VAIHVDVIAALNQRSVAQTTSQLNAGIPDTMHVKVKVDTSDLGRVQKDAKSAHDVIQELGTAAFKTGRGLATIGAAPVVGGLLEIVKVGTAATQALWLLPAAASAAAAGIGTLAIATHGFGDAIKHMGDPKKWAEDLQSLSPAAQQAALQIKNLVDGPLGDLKRATQDAFFANMSEQINSLTTKYLPSLQNMTTSIATSFNQMMTGVANQLMTPETLGSMQTMFANISQMFRNLAPAAAPVVKAFTDIATVGSGFLPGLATSITNAANSFATFISNARESGQLQVWIQQGIDAVKNLSTAAWELIQIFYRVFGPSTTNGIEDVRTGVSSLDQTFQSFSADLTKISDIIGILSIDTSTWSRVWNQEMLAMQGPLGVLRDAILDIPEAFMWTINKVIDGINWAKHGVENFAETATNAVNIVLPDSLHRTFEKLPDIPHVGSGGDWGGYQDTRGPFGNDQAGGQTPLGGDPNAQRQRQGLPPITDFAGTPGPLFPVPPPPPGPAGAKPSDRERRDAIIAGLDPALWRVDPFAQVPGLPGVGSLHGGPMPGGGYGAASGQEFFEGQQAIIQQGHELEEAKKDRLALERDNEATAEQINDAKWKEYQAGVELQKAQADLVEKTKGTAQDMKQGMDDLGVALDPDLGLGKGLAGFADNLVRFLGNVAAAPMMAELNTIKNSTEARTGIKGGYGFLGMRGARNLSQGLSPLLGNPLPGGGTAALSSPSSYSPTSSSTGPLNSMAAVPGSGQSYGLPAGTDIRQGASGFPPWVYAVGQAFGLDASTYAGHQEGKGVNQGIDWWPKGKSDMSGQSYTAEEAGRLDAFAKWLDSTGLAEQVIWEHPQTGQQTGFPDNTDYSGNFPGHRGHVHTRHSSGLPVPGDALAAGTAGAAMASAGGMGGFTPGSGVVPVFVTNFGGMGAGGGGGLSALFGGGGAAPAGLGVGGSHLANWDAIMGAEAGGSGGWQANTGNGFYGGLQFTQSSWDAAKPPGAPERADLATPEQQKAAGDKLLQMQGPAAWPATSAAHPQWFKPTVPTGPGGNPATATTGGATAPSPYTGNPANVGSNTPSGLLPTTTDPSRIGGLAPIAPNPGGQGIGIMPGGTIDAAIQGGLNAAGGAAGAFGGGAGGAAAAAAAQTIMKLANRAIQFGGQAAGIGVSGLMETFLPTGGSELANNNWLTRIAGGIAAAAPALPNLAGGALGQQQMQGPLTPEQIAANGNQHGQAGGAAPGPVVGTLNYNNIGAPEDRAGADITHHLGQVAAAPMAGAGGPVR
jgi:methyl-accepting chemotaxis protein